MTLIFKTSGAASVGARNDLTGIPSGENPGENCGPVATPLLEAMGCPGMCLGGHCGQPQLPGYQSRQTKRMQMTG